VKFPYYGPRRPGLQPCACGYAFVSYKRHRQTKVHKEALRRWRKEDRERVQDEG
jgi:hypothetical protein